MNDEQRDELLIRIDERVKDIKEEELPKITGHLERLNNSVSAHSVDIGSLKEKASFQWKVVCIIIGGSGAVGAGVAKLFELLG
mgnify:CR=1 FL=1